jgi:hypothetical protein
MYTREILPPIDTPIEEGNPLFGTWDRAFEKVDLLEIQKPFKLPMPGWLRNSRIKEWEYFSAQDEFFQMEAVFCNLKLYRIIQVLMYDKKNNKKIYFRKIKPGKGWRLPQSLANTSIDSHSSGFYFRVHSWLDADTVKLDINIEAARRRSSLIVHLTYNVSRQNVIPLAVSLGISAKRALYAYKALAPVQGDIVFEGRNISLKQNTCSGFFCDYKGFLPYNMQTTTCSGTGFSGENRRFGFHIAENQTRETNKNNENALWVNGQLTPLPPVRITMPNGIDAEWIIQDVEGMVDLKFTPKDINRSRTKLLVINAELYIPIGIFSGTLVDGKGEKIQFKNLYGAGKKLNLRV